MVRPSINLKRAYDPVSDEDRMRILVERLWPRGLSKADAAIDHWMKDIAPTSELRTWFGHRLERWPEFRKLYRAELKRNVAPVEDLRALCDKHRVSFIFAARDIERNGAVVLRDYIARGSRQNVEG